MNIQSEKLGLIEWIAKINDLSIIEKLRKIHDEYAITPDWWDEISIEEKKSIQKGLEDIEKGHIHSHENVKGIYEKYL